jgi:hypothetical protein
MVLVKARHEVTVLKHFGRLIAYAVALYSIWLSARRLTPLITGACKRAPNVAHSHSRCPIASVRVDAIVRPHAQVLASAASKEQRLMRDSSDFIVSFAMAIS